MESLRCPQRRLTQGAPLRSAVVCPAVRMVHGRRPLQIAAAAYQPTLAAASVVSAVTPVHVSTPSGGMERVVPELDPKSFYDFISGDALCVVDYYSDWCGPCQLMHKELDKLTAAFKSVRFAKINCGHCPEFSTRQRIRSLPTFRLYYKGTCLDEITGAKPMQLRQLLTHYICMTSISR
ncbi:hypothetical protein Agub_g12438 [Astrephomene gubernaculifera]|uniref:Thioredoxin domain-containing protein n=1 Tax=Astrephomene gubernaculifera TaxID=47775 RepID=A0AAD3DZU9_9CHLO|nr:hypothetical protein Agub_g12438 [Astrephomene gubernaculifera]